MRTRIGDCYPIALTLALLGLVTGFVIGLLVGWG